MPQTNPELPAAVRAFLSRNGQKGGHKGGTARARNLTIEQLRACASYRDAAGRWKKKKQEE